jgi:hypothetical protein
MSPEQEEVERSIRELGLQGKLDAYPLADAKRLYEELEGRFSDTKGATRIWEHLRLPSISRHFSDDRAFERLPRIVPAASDEVLFFPGSDQDVVCAYRGTIEAISAVIGDCFAFEYCVAPLGLDWLVCENHHSVLIAVGEPVGSRLRAVDGG